MNIPFYSNCTPLSTSDPAYDAIVNKVNATYPNACITMIDKYDNPVLKESYNKWRESLDESKRTEYIVYHGTKYQYVESICKNGFQPSHGKVMAYGYGIYFARDFRLSWVFADKGNCNDKMSYIFVCKITPGRLGPANAEGYDSNTDSVVNPSIFAIPKACMMIPEYLVRFHKDSEKINVTHPRYTSRKYRLPKKMNIEYQ